MKLQLDWSAYAEAGQGDVYAGIPATGGDFARAVSVCISDRHCLANDKGVMCPSFRVTGDIQQSPGARLALLKRALNGEFGAEPFRHPQVWAALDTCVGCKGCKRECANQVDVAAIRLEVLAQAHGDELPLRSRLFAGLPDRLARSRVLRPLIRWRNRWPWLARLGESLTGIAAGRKLPEPAARPFVAPGGSSAGATVMLFVDTYARWFEPDVASAACQVLVAAGHRVQVLGPAADDVEPDRPLCCGRTWLAQGQVATARAMAQRMLAALRPALAAGLPVVGLEPSCVLMLRDEYQMLGLGEEAKALAGQVWLLGEFIAREAERQRFAGLFRDMGGQRLLVHGHCHEKAVGAMKSLRKVLRLIPGLEVDFIEASCCGMAGGFGYEAEHADLSLAMAELALLPALRDADASCQVLANGWSCRRQIEGGSGRHARHLALLLRDALASAAVL
jgi:Fe-S oxidoreductase